MTQTTNETSDLSEDEAPPGLTELSDPPILNEEEDPLSLEPGPGDPQLQPTDRLFEVGPEADLAQQHQKHQFRIVVGLLIALAVFTALIIVLALTSNDQSWSRLSSQLAFLITPIHTLVGIAVGYYFATEKKK